MHAPSDSGNTSRYLEAATGYLGMPNRKLERPYLEFGVTYFEFGNTKMEAGRLSEWYRRPSVVLNGIFHRRRVKPASTNPAPNENRY